MAVFMWEGYRILMWEGEDTHASEWVKWYRSFYVKRVGYSCEWMSEISVFMGEGEDTHVSEWMKFQFLCEKGKILMWVNEWNFSLCEKGKILMWVNEWNCSFYGRRGRYSWEWMREISSFNVRRGRIIMRVNEWNGSFSPMAWLLYKIPAYYGIILSDTYIL